MINQNGEGRKSIKKRYQYVCLLFIHIVLISLTVVSSGQAMAKRDKDIQDQDLSQPVDSGKQEKVSTVSDSPLIKEGKKAISKGTSVKESSQDINLQVESKVKSKDKPKVESLLSFDAMSSREFVSAAWAASHKRDYEQLDLLAAKCVELYGNEALLVQEQLSAFPTRIEVENYQALNDVATCLFVQAEALMNNGQNQEAIVAFQYIIDTYPWSQSWDPRGWYWSVAEKSQASIDVLTGKAQDEIDSEVVEIVSTKPVLFTVGTEEVVDYSKYGVFLNVGTDKYRYSIKDIAGLAAAVGEGIYPNTSSVYNNPRYQELRKSGKLDGSHWDFVNSFDLEAAYFKWVTAPEPWGVRLFYIGLIFEKSGMYYEALKAYRALIVHYSRAVGWTYWQTPWYPAQAAIAKIKHIIRSHPDLNIDYKWMKVQIQNGFDNDVQNDIFITHPGKIVKRGLIDRVSDHLPWKESIELEGATKTVGNGEVQLVQYSNGHWQLLVNKKPFVIRGITYAPTKIGQSPDKGTLANWMEEDTNGNGLADGPYDAWVDANGNNQQDADELTVGDFQLMKNMGVNTLRIYHQPDKPNKELLRKMYKEYGFRVIMGDFLGKYTIGSGASWEEGTDYENAQHRKNMLESVKIMINEYKDEPYILMWVLGNENNYGVASNADKKPQAYFEFVDEVARWIKRTDKNHPVSLNNGDTLFLDLFARYSPNVDIYSANVYRGDYGFGSFWEQVFDATGKPAYISEFGCPAYAPHLTLKEAQEAQALYHQGNWIDIEENLAGRVRGVGNSLGGVIFEWLDEWWKSYEPYLHDRKSDALGPFPGGYYYEEWFGIIGQGKGQHSPFLRQLRDSYYTYQQLWSEGN